MKFLCIQNIGEIEEEALHLIGASTKRLQTNKIGQFGSGNKYALAYLVRNGYDVQIWSGTKQITITTQDVSFRENDFKVICLNGKQTSITTAMGKDWSLWQALREIYCNALDEGEAFMDVEDEIIPAEGVTKFYITNTSEVQDFMLEFDKYFGFNKKVLFENEFGRILEKTGSTANIYRRGIRCMNTTSHSVFDYDFKDISVNEDRLVMYNWEVPSLIWKLVMKCTNKSVIRKILMSSCLENMMENQISEFTNLETEMSQEFEEANKDLVTAPSGMSGLLSTEEIAGTIIVPTKVFQVTRPKLEIDNTPSQFRVDSSGMAFRAMKKSDFHSEVLKQCMDFFAECRFEMNYPIEVAVFEDKRILGLAYKDTIYISEIGMERGIIDVCNTIIEEYVHLKHDVKDKTRAMQTAIISEFLVYMQKINSYAK